MDRNEAIDVNAKRRGGRERVARWLREQQDELQDEQQDEREGKRYAGRQSSACPAGEAFRHGPRHEAACNQNPAASPSRRLSLAAT